jgi:hypothetical protein
MIGRPPCGMALPFLCLIAVISTFVPPRRTLRQLASPTRFMTAFHTIGRGRASRFGVALLGGANHCVEPFADGHSGAARGVAGGRTGFWTETSEIPRTARFHAHAQIDAREIGCAP